MEDDETQETQIPKEYFIDFEKIEFIEKIGDPSGQSIVYSGTFKENSETIHQVAIKEIKEEHLVVTDFTLSM
jgi:hypothetical protein